ncbi:MAG: ankyrin repeat domain-containing protein [Planctomycetes bacterium]|nr:ankyrin repeat domain-containing protein [Planctomycetota bacterium]
MTHDDPASGREQPSPAVPVWVDATANRFGMPVLDFTPVFAELTSASTNPEVAARAVSWGRTSIGLELDAAAVESLAPIACDLRYPAARVLPDGLLFTPGAMEEKWVLVHRAGEVLAARSWTGAVLASARARREGDLLVLHALRVSEEANLASFGDAVEVFDWLVRSHALGELLPLPVSEEAAASLERAPLAGFSVFGSRLVCAARRWAPPPPSRPLRADGAVLMAVRRGDAQAVRDLVAGGEAVDPPTTFAGYTPLAIALVRGDVAMVRTLLDLGADPGARDDRGNFPLGIGVVHGAPREALEALLARRADPRAVNADGYGALHAAAEVGNAGAIPWLLGLGLEVDARTGRGHTALQIAAALGRLDAVKALVEAGADVRAGSPNGTALEIAREEGKGEVAAFLAGGE